MHDENKMDLIVNDILTEKWAIGKNQNQVVDVNFFAFPTTANVSSRINVIIVGCFFFGGFFLACWTLSLHVCILISGRIQDIDSNLFIGKGKGFDNFSGFIDEVCL